MPPNLKLDASAVINKLVSDQSKTFVCLFSSDNVALFCDDRLLISDAPLDLYSAASMWSPAVFSLPVPHAFRLQSRSAVMKSVEDALSHSGVVSLGRKGYFQTADQRRMELQTALLQYSTKPPSVDSLRLPPVSTFSTLRAICHESDATLDTLGEEDVRLALLEAATAF
eukprot:4713212-Prymnesium_polylepis.1